MLKNNPAALLVFLISSSPLVGDCDAALDVDGDGWVACTDPSQLNSQTCDCNDLDPAISPDGIETDNQIDDDCDGIPEWLDSDAGSYPQYPSAYGPARRPLEFPDLTLGIQYGRSYIHLTPTGEVIPTPQDRTGDPDACTCSYMVVVGPNEVACYGLSYDLAGTSWACIEVLDLDFHLLQRSDRLLEGTSVVGGLAYVASMNSIIVAGGYTPATRLDTDAFIMKLDPQLNRDWIVTDGQVGFDDEVRALAGLDDQTVAAAGYNLAADPDNGTWIVKVDMQGAVLWEETSASSREIFASDIIAATGGSFLVSGSTNGSAVTPFVVKFATNGTVSWDWTPGIQYGGRIRGGMLDESGSFVLAAAYGQYYHAICLTSDGSLVWDQGPKLQGETFSVIRSHDSGYLITGWYKDPKFSNAYAHVMRVDEDFNTPPGDYYGETGWY